MMSWNEIDYGELVRELGLLLGFVILGLFIGDALAAFVIAMIALVAYHYYMDR